MWRGSHAERSAGITALLSASHAAGPLPLRTRLGTVRGVRVPRRSRRRVFVLAALLACFTVVLFELVAPLVLPALRIGPFWAFDPVLGWTNVPDREYEWDIDGEIVSVGFNDRGFHDVSHTSDRPDGVRRIVLIGDSFSEATQVQLEETFHRRLAHRLEAEAEDRWEVINLGVGDFGTAQACLAFERLGLAYDPEILLVEIFPLNDLTNNSLELYDTSGSDNDGFRPYFVERDGALELTSAHPARHWLRRHSATFLCAEMLLSKIRGRRSDAQRNADRGRRNMDLGFQGMLPPVYQTYVDDAHQHPAIRRAWHLTELILGRIVTTARAHGVKVLFVVVPWDRSVGAAAWERFVGGMPSTPLQPDYPERRLSELSARLGVPCLLLKPTFEQHVDEFFPPRRDHFNPAAHRLTADAIFAKLQEERMLDE